MSLTKTFLKALTVPFVGLALSGCAPSPSTQGNYNIDTTKNSQALTSGPRILIMGDSMLAWNSYTKRSVGYRLSAKLDEPILDKSTNGATVLTGLRGGISGQFQQGNWDWVVMNGGGNDLWLGCGCTLCDFHLDQMISDTGKHGKIPDTVSRVRRTGAKVIYIGYLRSPGTLSPIEHCATSGARLEGRLDALAQKTDGFYFVPLDRLVPNGDSSYHSVDKIHPSMKGSDAIANMIAQVIWNAEGDRDSDRAPVLALR